MFIFLMQRCKLIISEPTGKPPIFESTAVMAACRFFLAGIPMKHELSEASTDENMIAFSAFARLKAE
jgi:hypothetical protein